MTRAFLIGALAMLALTSCEQPSNTASSSAQAPLPVAAPAPWAPIAFDDQASTLPASPSNDAHKFFSLFRQRLAASAKGEFETTEQFQTRMAKDGGEGTGPIVDE